MNATKTEILETAKKFDTARRVKAVTEFTHYRLMPDGSVINMKNGEIYTASRWNEQKGWVGCSCPDSGTRVQKMRDALANVGEVAPCSCKYRYIRQLLNGEEVRIGNSRFTAKVKK
jgi:hypothetical protein